MNFGVLYRGPTEKPASLASCSSTKHGRDNSTTTGVQGVVEYYAHTRTRTYTGMSPSRQAQL